MMQRIPDWLLNRSEWMTRNEVKRYLRVSFPLLMERMYETPQHIERPWLAFGNTKKSVSGVRYRFHKDRVNDWWIAVNRFKFGKKPGLSAYARKMEAAGVNS